LEVDEEDIEEIDNTLLVKIYKKPLDRDYQQVFHEREIINKPKFRY